MAEISAAQDIAKRGVVPFLIDEATSQIIVFDAVTLRLVWANKAACAYLRCTLRDIRRARAWDLFPGVPEARLKRLAAAVRRRAKPHPNFICSSHDEEDRSFSVSILHHAARKSSIVVTLRDVSWLALARSEAMTAQENLRMAIETLTDGFVLYDADDRLVICNQTYRDFYDRSAPFMVPGARFEDILREGAARGQYTDAIGREDAWIAERMAQHRKGEVELEQRLTTGRWLRIVERVTPNGGRVGLRIDITTLKNQQAELSRLARTDDLTGLRNRRDLADDIADLARTTPDGSRVAIYYVDLDRFKAVNDVYGHAAGDHVLKVAAQIFCAGPNPPDIVARVGGDDFVLVKVTQKSDADICRYGRMLKNLLAEPICFEEHTCNIGASIGVAFLASEDVEQAKETLIAADIAMNRARLNKVSGVVIFENAMREQTTRNTHLVEEIQEGLKRNEFRPYFQPQINARTGKTTGFEALIRWERGAAPPVAAGEFLAVAQDAGLTQDLDRIVLEQSCIAVKRMMSWGLKDPCVSLNLSMRQITDAGLVNEITDCIIKHGISRHNMRIELLESTLLDDRASTTIENVHRLIEAGLQVELDDFGTGHAAIATLRKFAVSQIKIDRSLIRYIDRDTDLQTITSAIVKMAQSLGISVLAEGVETPEEQAVLLKFKCDAAQGYLHARPMPLEDLRDFLIKRGDLPDGPLA